MCVSDVLSYLNKGGGLESAAGVCRRRPDMVSIYWRVSTGGCGSVRCAKVRHGSCFHRRKWAWSGLSRTRLAVQRMPTRRLVNRIVTSVREGDNNKRPHREVFLDTGKSLSLLKKMSRKFFRTSYIVALCSLCRVLLFPWIY